MAVKIRLQRHGKKGKPFYWIVAADARSKRDGKYLEKIGTYDPNQKPAAIDLNFDSAISWLDKGAQPTNTAKAILSYTGVLLKRHLDGGVKKGAFTEAEAKKRFDAWMKDKSAKIEKKIQDANAALESNKKEAREREEEYRKKKLEEAKAKEKAKAEEAETKVTEADKQLAAITQKQEEFDFDAALKKQQERQRADRAVVDREREALSQREEDIRLGRKLSLIHI